MYDKFTTNAPIYLQLAEIFKMFVVTGEWPPGEKIHTVRELSEEYGVNPNTIQRALMDMERDELLYSERTTGRYTTDNILHIQKLKESMAKQFTETFFENMNNVGYTKEEIRQIVNREVDKIE